MATLLAVACGHPQLRVARPAVAHDGEGADGQGRATSTSKQVRSTVRSVCFWEPQYLPHHKRLVGEPLFNNFVGHSCRLPVPEHGVEGKEQLAHGHDHGHLPGFALTAQTGVEVADGGGGACGGHRGHVEDFAHSGPRAKRAVYMAMLHMKISSGLRTQATANVRVWVPLPKPSPLDRNTLSNHPGDTLVNTLTRSAWCG